MSSLVDKGFLEADGVGRGTKYQISSMFDVGSSDDAQDGSTNIMNDVKLNEDEIKILSYIQ